MFHPDFGAIFGNRRLERAVQCLASNERFSAWAIFGQAVIVAMIDKPVSPRRDLARTGDSCRLRDEDLGSPRAGD